MDIDEGWRLPEGLKDKYGNEVEDRIYNLKDYDRTLSIDEDAEGSTEDYWHLRLMTGSPRP